MIANHQIEVDSSGTILYVSHRSSVKHPYKEEKKSFLKEQNAIAALNQLEKRVLIDQLKNYIDQCEMVIKWSPNQPYYESKKPALTECKQLKKLCLDLGTSKKTAAKMILMHRKHLAKIIPHSKNDGYRTAMGNYEEVIAQARKIIGAKRVTIV